MAADLAPLSDEQWNAYDRINTFLTARQVERPYLVVHGLAGVGKSHLLAHIAQRFPRAEPCALFGKAASVLSRRIGRDASTVHSILYRFQGEYVDENSGEKYLSFAQKVMDGAWNGRRVLLDEAGVVPVDIAQDLLATGCRIVATGDPGQLRPVRGVRFFETPDLTLHHIHRQALELAIIRQAHTVRQTGTYKADGEDFRVQRHVGRDDILAADVILCWRNATRHALNALARAHRGLDGPPVAREQIVCLRNDKRMGVLNGARYALIEDYDAQRRLATIVNERGETVVLEECRLETFDPPGDPNDPDQRDEHPIAFGDAMTVHKYIGSETDRGILVDEYDRHEQRREFLYTGITRFAKQVLVHSQWA